MDIHGGPARGLRAPGRPLAPDGRARLQIQVLPRRPHPGDRPHRHPEQCPVLGVHEELEQTVGIAHDRAAGEVPIACDPHLERDVGRGELIFGLADETDLRDRVDADRLEIPAVAPTGSSKA